MNLRLIKAADAILGRIAAALLPAPVVGCHGTTIRSVLFIRPGGIGDAVLLIPAIHSFRSKYPKARITVLAEKRNGAVFTLCSVIDEILHYDNNGELFMALRGSYDAVIDTEQWHRLSAVVARMTRAQILIGFGTNVRSRLFTHPHDYEHNDYEETSFLRLLTPLGITVTQTSVPFLTVPTPAVSVARVLLGELANIPFVVIFPGASIPERRWGADNFRQVAKRLSAKGVSGVVVGGEDDRVEGERIVADTGWLNLIGRTSLQESTAIIERSSLLVSGDSGILHIAVGLGVPTVSLFGPGREKKWAPRGDNHIVINKHLPCSPCTTFGYTPKCPINARCMAEISVDEVESAVLTLLAVKKIE